MLISSLNPRHRRAMGPLHGHRSPPSHRASSMPTGTVTFVDGDTTLGTGALTSGVATFATSTLSVGSHTIAASYPGQYEFHRQQRQQQSFDGVDWRIGLGRHWVDLDIRPGAGDDENRSSPPSPSRPFESTCGAKRCSRQPSSTFLKPIEALLNDKTVTEIMVNGHEKIYIERRGRLIRAHACFPTQTPSCPPFTTSPNGSAAKLPRNTRCSTPGSQRLAGTRDHSAQRKAGRLPDNPQVLPARASTANDLIHFGSLRGRQGIYRDLRGLRKNILIGGGTGTGKTSFGGRVPGHSRGRADHRSSKILRSTVDQAIAFIWRPSTPTPPARVAGCPRTVP